MTRSNIYYQISDSLVRRHGNQRYFVKENIEFQFNDMGIERPVNDPIIMMFHADIVWRETGDKVVFLKHRYIDHYNYTINDEDIKRFRWVKLSAVDVSKSPSIRKL